MAALPRGPFTKTWRKQGRHPMALWGKSILGRRKNECKSPEAGTCQVSALFRNYNGVQCGGRGVNKGKGQGQNPVAIWFSFWVKWQSRDFSGGLVTKTLHFQCRGPGFHHWAEIPHAAVKDPAGCNKDRRPCMRQLRPLVDKHFFPSGSGQWGQLYSTVIL